MILTGLEIQKNVLEGRITIEPFHPEQINPNSYNYRLGKVYYEIEETNSQSLSEEDVNYVEKEFSEEGTILYPNKVYLAVTEEVIGSENYVTTLIGKSSMGRLGMFLQLSADLGHEGEIHKWTLEITPSIPIRVYPHMIIGQVMFWKVEGEKFNSKGYYKRFNAPMFSRGLQYDIKR